MFVEEFVWDRLTAFMALIGRLPLIRGLEHRISVLPPYPAMAMFLLPGILLLPVKLAALWFVAKGQAMLGVSVIVAAKIVGTALVARIFSLCRPTLLSVAWFARVYEWIIRVKTALYCRIKSSAPWQAAVRLKRRIADFLRPYRGQILRRRWKAIARWLRWGRNSEPETAIPPAPSTEIPPHNGCE